MDLPYPRAGRRSLRSGPPPRRPLGCQARGRLPEFLDRHNPDLFLCIGDWGDPGEVPEAQYEAVLQRVLTLSIWGNHDDREQLARLRNRDGTPVLLEEGAVREFGGIAVAGI